MLWDGIVNLFHGVHWKLELIAELINVLSLRRLGLSLSLLCGSHCVDGGPGGACVKDGQYRLF